MAALASPRLLLNRPSANPSATIGGLRASTIFPNRNSTIPNNSHRVLLSSRPTSTSRPGLCHASGSGPPEPGPSSGEGPVRLTGIASSLSRLQDRVQIFVAVLFWMSLFFWASAWDGRDRPNKGSRFRR